MRAMRLLTSAVSIDTVSRKLFLSILDRFFLEQLFGNKNIEASRTFER
jgi:hypothetical protein